MQHFIDPSTRSFLVRLRVSISLIPGTPFFSKYSGNVCCDRQLEAMGESSRTTNPEHIGAAASSSAAVMP